VKLDVQGLSEHELELLEELFLEAGVPVEDLEEPKGTDNASKLRKAIWESWWVQLITWVELGQMRRASDAVRILIDLEEKWRVNESE
jgi:hypothetical protein